MDMNVDLQGAHDLQHALLSDAEAAQAGGAVGGIPVGAPVVMSEPIPSTSQVQDILVKDKLKHSDSDSGKGNSSCLDDLVCVHQH